MVPCHNDNYGTWKRNVEILKSSYGGGQVIKGGTNFYGGELTSLNTTGLSNYYYFFNTILTRKIQHNILYFINTT